MFCPKCGTQNPDNGKFCRTCGTDLGNVSTALSGDSNQRPAFFRDRGGFYTDRKGRLKSNDPEHIFAEAVKNIIVGIGFLVVAAVLFFTNVAGGNNWWWAMLFPAFGCLGKGVSDVIRYGMTKERKNELKAEAEQHLNSAQSNASLPPTQTEYIKPQGSIYETGELVAPPSVTEDTTRHLQINKDGETMTLPKK